VQASQSSSAVGYIMAGRGPVVYVFERGSIGASKREARDFCYKGDEDGIQWRHDDGRDVVAMRGWRTTRSVALAGRLASHWTLAYVYVCLVSKHRHFYIAIDEISGRHRKYVQEVCSSYGIQVLATGNTQPHTQPIRSAVELALLLPFLATEDSSP
jgi:hypothetical protein